MQSFVRLLLALVAVAPLAGCPTGDDDDSSAINCTSDNRPTLVITSPDNALIVEPGTDVTWALTVTDPDTDIADVLIELGDVSDSTWNGLDITVPVPNDNGQTTFTMSSDVLDDGSNVIRVRVTDPDGCTTNDQILLCLDTDTCP